MAEKNSMTEDFVKEPCTSVEEPAQGKPLQDLTNLTRDIVDSTAYLTEAVQRMETEIENVKYNIATGSCLHIGKESIQSLAELKSTAVEVFANATPQSDVKLLCEEVNLETLEENLEKLKKQQSETRQFIGYMNHVSEAIVKVGGQKNPKTSGSDSDSSASILSASGNDPSASGFSLFDNSNTNVATSSPLSNLHRD